MTKPSRRLRALIAAGLAITLTAPWEAKAVAQDVDIAISELDPGALEEVGRMTESFDPLRPHIPATVVVKLKPGQDPGLIFAEPHIQIVDFWWEVSLPAGSDAAEAAPLIARRPGVELVDLSYMFAPEPAPAVVATPPFNGVAAADPNDPFYGYQWNFPAVQLPEAWDRSTGAGAVVAVLDTGVVPAGQTLDLSCHTYTSEYNAITDVAGPGAAPDTFGHGTHVTGTVSQCTGNGVGVAGVAPGAAIMPVDVFTTSSSPQWTSTALARGIGWAADHGADVINMSLGTSGCPAPCTNPVVSDAIDYAAALDVVVVAAAGNAGSSSLGGHFPANHPEVIAVGATDTRNVRTQYSNYGSGLDLVAPGGDTSIDRNGDGLADGIVQETLAIACGASPPPNTTFCAFQGTSMASPHVAGAVALMRAAVPGATRSQVRSALWASALDLGPGGYDIEYGYGLLQVDDAIAHLQAVTSDTTAPTWPAGSAVSQLANTSTTVSIDWPAASDNVGVDRYEVSVDGDVIGFVTGSAATISGLESATLYQVSVRALDAAGNRSEPLTSVVGTGGVDDKAPVWDADSEIVAVDVFESRVIVEWSMTATDVSGVAEFRVFAGPFDRDSNVVNGSLVAVLSATQSSFEIQGLLTDTDYGAWVEAADPEGNVTDDGPITVFHTATDFRDTNGHLFAEDIEWLSGAAITSGCNPPTNDLFCPADSVTRGQMAAFLARALSLPVAAADFFDDDDHSVFERDINALAQAGITAGCNPPDNTRFCPSVPVTRGQMASFLVRALGLPGNQGPDNFIDGSGSPHRADIEALGAFGITRGCNPPVNDRFCPTDPVTRGQMAAFLRRALGLRDIA